MQIKLPMIAVLAGNPAVNADVLDKAHKRLGVPELVQALVRRLEAWQADRTLPAHLESKSTVEALLLAVHGAAGIATSLKRHAGVDKAAIGRFVKLIWSR